jgi:hypothetical protein
METQMERSDRERGRPRAEVVLGADKREALERWARRP